LISTRAALIDSPIAAPFATAAAASWDVKITPSLMKKSLPSRLLCTPFSKFASTNDSAIVSILAAADNVPGSTSAQPIRGRR